jgi:hypothetical protein
MNRRDFLQKQFELSVRAGTSQRYHQNVAQLWRRLDRAARFSSALFALLGATLAGMSILPAAQQPAWAMPVSMVLGLISAALGFGVLVMPVGTWELESQDLYRRWTDLRKDVDALEFELGDKPTATSTLVNSLSALERESHDLCGMEHAPSKALVRKLYDEEYASRLPAKAA